MKKLPVVFTLFLLAVSSVLATLTYTDEDGTVLDDYILYDTTYPINITSTLSNVSNCSVDVPFGSDILGYNDTGGDTNINVTWNIGARGGDFDGYGCGNVLKGICYNTTGSSETGDSVPFCLTSHNPSSIGDAVIDFTVQGADEAYDYSGIFAIVVVVLVLLCAWAYIKR